MPEIPSASNFQKIASKDGTGTDVILELESGIVVRAYRDEDVPSLAHHGNNKRIWDNLRDRMPHPYTKADAKWWMRHCRGTPVKSGPWTLERGSEGPLVAANYAIVVDGQAVGAIGLEFGSDVYRRTAELGYWLGEEYWGKGVMSRVVPAFVDWTWRTFDILIRLNGSTYEWNVQSGKLLEKAGFTREGRRPDATIKNGRIGAEIMWGALRSRWSNAVLSKDTPMNDVLD